MGIIFDTLAKSDSSVHNCTEQAPSQAMTKAYRKAAYPTGHDTTTEVTSAEGTMEGDASQQDKDDAHLGEIMVPATLFDQKVQELVEGAGAAYSVKAAEANGLMKRADPELIASIQRLEKNAPLLNRAMELTNQRLSKRQTQRTRWHSTGSVSGSVSGATSDTAATGGVSEDGSASGDVSEVTRQDVIKSLAGNIAARLKIMGRRVQA
jgi:hypothetical protein